MHRYLSSISSHVQPSLLFRKYHETKLVRQLSAGQPGAWVQLVERWSPHLYSYISYNVHNEDETRRLMHLILSEVIHTVIDTPQIRSLPVLIYSIAYRHILHYRWQQETREPAEHRSAQRSSAGSAEGRQDHRVSFVQRFGQFSPKTQQLLLLRYVCGVSLPELSQIVGQSEDVLAQTFYRAKLYLQ